MVAMKGGGGGGDEERAGGGGIRGRGTVGVESPMEGMGHSLGWWREVNNKNGRPLLRGATQRIYAALSVHARARLGHPCDVCTHTWTQLKPNQKETNSGQELNTLSLCTDNY